MRVCGVTNVEPQVLYTTRGPPPTAKRLDVFASSGSVEWDTHPLSDLLGQREPVFDRLGDGVNLLDLM